MGVFAVYKYYTVTNTSVYNDVYLQYDPGRTRSMEADPVGVAFTQKKWDDVILLAETNPGNTKNLFLSGIAYLEKGEGVAAADRFEKILQHNALTSAEYYNDEAEYYLAVALLRTGQPSKAAVLLNRISNSPDHIYRDKASGISGLDLTILKWKDK
jgi:tetratricopeptide (TPR) repeat protein